MLFSAQSTASPCTNNLQIVQKQIAHILLHVFSKTKPATLKGIAGLLNLIALIAGQPEGFIISGVPEPHPRIWQQVPF
jgi:hypothetical protein